MTLGLLFFSRRRIIYKARVEIIAAAIQPTSATTLDIPWHDSLSAQLQGSAVPDIFTIRGLCNAKTSVYCASAEGAKEMLNHPHWSSFLRCQIFCLGEKTSETILGGAGFTDYLYYDSVDFCSLSFYERSVFQILEGAPNLFGQALSADVKSLIAKKIRTVAVRRCTARLKKR